MKFGVCACLHYSGGIGYVVPRHVLKITCMSQGGEIKKQNKYVANDVDVFLFKSYNGRKLIFLYKLSSLSSAFCSLVCFKEILYRVIYDTVHDSLTSRVGGW